MSSVTRIPRPTATTIVRPINVENTRLPLPRQTSQMRRCATQVHAQETNVQEQQQGQQQVQTEVNQDLEWELSLPELRALWRNKDKKRRENNNDWRMKSRQDDSLTYKNWVRDEKDQAKSQASKLAKLREKQREDDAKRPVWKH